MPAATQQRISSTSPLDRFAELIAHFVPDAFTAAVIMMLMLAGAALMVGHSFLQIADAYYRGFWMLLPFAMQMTLIVVLS